MKRIKKYFTAFTGMLLLFACTKVPITGRRQVNMLPESSLMSMSLTNYRGFLSQNPPAQDAEANTQLVKKVGANISKAITEFMRGRDMEKRIKDYQWEFNLVNDKTVNAWCMPGGKVVVYSGLLAVTENETGLAVVMGHEIAHAIARHGNERMSQQLLLQAGSVGLAVALSSRPQETQNIFMQSYGIGSTLGVLKYSRTHESEADKLGLIFMAMAGYDPAAAIAFWERMAKQSGGNSPQFMSTHPSDETRIKDIKAFLPKAMKYYKPQTKS